MARRISDETKQLIGDLYAQELPNEEIARIAGVSESSVYHYTRILERGFATPAEYDAYLANKRGFVSTTEYRNHLALEKGFASNSEYSGHMVSQRQMKPENQALSHIIEIGLEELGKNQSWLAGQMGVTRAAVSLYVQGKRFPNGELLTRLFSSLEFPYKTISDLL